MKRLFLVICVIQICGQSLSAQKSPPPIIYKAPEKVEIREFFADDRSFQAAFPGVPNVSRQELENGSFTNFRVYRAGSNSVVNISVFNFDLETDRDKIYEFVRGNFLKTPNSRIETEKDISIGGKPAKEFEILRALQFQKTRILVSGSRVFEMTSDVTNWHLLSNLTKKEFFDETERFFSSFKLGAGTPGAGNQAPSDFLGFVENNVYKNSFFDFSVTFPADWHRLDEMEIQTGRKKGLELLKSVEEKINRAFERSTKQEVVIFAASQRNFGNQKGTNLFIGVLKQPAAATTAEMVAAATKNTILLNPKFKLVQDVKPVELNGTRFANFLLETTVNERTFNQKVLIIMRRGYSVSITMSYYSDDGLKTLDGILKSLIFK